MIPVFPEFKKITVTDRKEVESFINPKYPYSTFNFTNLWAWNTREERRVSNLNGNLVIFYTEYKSKNPFLAFLGTQKVTETIDTLTEYAIEKKISSKLRFITEETIKMLDENNYLITPDRDNFDYVFSTQNLAHPNGTKLKERRHLAQKFTEKFSNIHFKQCDLNDAEIQKQIISVIRKWEANKIRDNKEYDLEHEEEAIRRLFRTAIHHELTLTCVFIENHMIGFSIDEVVLNNYAIAHFIKADNTYKGVYEFLNEHTAGVLLERGVLYWNWQQDLGITGLRDLKLSYHPVHFLKKYLVEKK